METVTLSSKGQLVIPSHVRAIAHLHAGDLLEVRCPDGAIRLGPVARSSTTTFDGVVGCLANSGRLTTLTSKPLSDAHVHATVKVRLKREDASTPSSQGGRPVKVKKSTACQRNDCTGYQPVSPAPLER